MLPARFWEPRSRHPGLVRENLLLFNFDVFILAGLVPYPRKPGSDREARFQRIHGAQVVPKSGLDLSAEVSTTAATG